MARVPLRPWVEHAFEQRYGVTLATWARQRRREGATWEELADELYERTDFVDGAYRLTGATMRNWFGSTRSAAS